MKITAIKQQVKRSDRYSLYVDGVYVFSFSESELLASGVKIGQEFSEKELDDMKMRATLDKAYDRTLNLISHRPRSEWELSDYLRRKDYDQQTSKAVIEKLRARGYVNDEDFARRWVENRRLLKATTKRRLTQELRQKRIDNEIIEQVLRADETDEKEVLRELIERKSAQTRYKDEKRLIAYLMRQGFQYSDIKTALANKSTK